MFHLMKRLPRRLVPPALALALAACGGGGGGNAPGPAPPPTLGAGPASCINGTADGYACRGISLRKRVSLQTMGAPGGNDIWGWTDPATNREYALVGLVNGTAFVDVTNPVTPVFLGTLPTQTVSSTWRDIKVYAN